MAGGRVTWRRKEEEMEIDKENIDTQIIDNWIENQREKIEIVYFSISLFVIQPASQPSLHPSIYPASQPAICTRRETISRAVHWILVEDSTTFGLTTMFSLNLSSGSAPNL